MRPPRGGGSFRGARGGFGRGDRGGRGGGGRGGFGRGGGGRGGFRDEGPPSEVVGNSSLSLSLLSPAFCLFCTIFVDISSFKFV